MTRIDRILKRETAVNYRGTPLVIELHPKYASLRRKGAREAVSISYEAIFEAAYKLYAREAAAQRRRNASMRPR